MPVFTASMVDLRHLNPAHVSYEPKDIHTEAVLVTYENIGQLSLEFETELFNSAHHPHFRVVFARRLEQDTNDGMTGVMAVVIKPGDWIVPLRREIHVYADDMFRNTFTFDPGYSPEDYALRLPIVPTEEVRTQESLPAVTGF